MLLNTLVDVAQAASGFYMLFPGDVFLWLFPWGWVEVTPGGGFYMLFPGDVFLWLFPLGVGWKLRQVVGSICCFLVMFSSGFFLLG